MWIEAKLKCEVDHTPYRVYINDELITERFYTIDPASTASNDLLVHLKPASEYDIRIENLSDNLVTLSEYTTKEQLDEN